MYLIVIALTRPDSLYYALSTKRYYPDVRERCSSTDVKSVVRLGSPHPECFRFPTLSSLLKDRRRISALSETLLRIFQVPDSAYCFSHASSPVAFQRHYILRGAVDNDIRISNTMPTLNITRATNLANSVRVVFPLIALKWR